MQAITIIGLDIAKSVFQVHGVGADGQVVLRRQLKRRYVLAFFEKLAPCLVGIEASASSHHCARQLQALGHKVRLMPPVYVKPYVKRQKNDATDAEAICEAVGRANMRFVPAKTPEQQGGLVLHRTRHLFIRQQTSVINAIRAHCAEFGIVAPLGRRGFEELLNVIANAKDEQVPAIARACVAALGAQLRRFICFSNLVGTITRAGCSSEKGVKRRRGELMTSRNNKAADEHHLISAYREIGIKAVAGAVKSNRQKDGSDDVDRAEQGEASMNEQSRRFAEKTTKTMRENLERGASATEDATRNAEQSYSSAFSGMRELNLRLIEMAHANTEAAFQLAHEVASAEEPSDLAAIWAEHAQRQFELMTKQSKELTDLGQKLAGRTTEPLARTVKEAFARGTGT